MEGVQNFWESLNWLIQLYCSSVSSVPLIVCVDEGEEGKYGKGKIRRRNRDRRYEEDRVEGKAAGHVMNYYQWLTLVNNQVKSQSSKQGLVA